MFDKEVARIAYYMSVMLEEKKKEADNEFCEKTCPSTENLDLNWDVCVRWADDFQHSVFNNHSKPLMDCLKDYYHYVMEALFEKGKLEASLRRAEAMLKECVDRIAFFEGDMVVEVLKEIGFSEEELSKYGVEGVNNETH